MGRNHRELVTAVVTAGTRDQQAASERDNESSVC